MKRQSNFELLRIFSMLLVVGLHTLNKGGAMWETAWGSVNHLGSWFLEACCFGAVNLFLMITGWFGSKGHFRAGKLIYIWISTLFYSVCIFLVSFAAGVADCSNETFRYTFFPISAGNYWFVANYMVLLLLMPFLNKILCVLNVRGRRIMAAILLCVYCVWHTILPFTTGVEVNVGYSLGWTLSVYCLTACVRLDEKLKKYFFGLGVWKCFLGFIVTSLVTFGSRYLFVAVGWSNYSLNLFTYNSPTVVLASLFVFIAFANLKICNKKISVGAVFIAKHAFAVYLIHENPFVRRLLWEKLQTVMIYDSVWLLPTCIVVLISIFTVCVCVSVLADPIIKTVTRLFCHCLKKPVCDLDALMNSL